MAEKCGECGGRAYFDDHTMCLGCSGSGLAADRKSPAPAPLRDAREVDVEAIAKRWWERYGSDENSLAPMAEWLSGKKAIAGAIREALEADRAGRQPDVERLRGLLEEGVTIAERFSIAFMPTLRVWARQAREALK